MTTVKYKAAEALAPILSVFDSIAGESLKAVRKVYTEGSLERLVLDFGSASLVIFADENDDSVDIAVTRADDMETSNAVEGSDSEPWKSFIGKPFGWGWLTVNQQGFCDGLLLSFGGIVPQLVLNVIASSIKVGTITAAG